MSSKDSASKELSQAWRKFCDEIKETGDTILNATPDTPHHNFDQAEGFRYISRITRLAFEQIIENSDPLAPLLQRGAREDIKMGCDNPDSYYLLANLSGDHNYKIIGKRNTIQYFSMGTYYGGDYGKSGRSGIGGSLESSDLLLDEEGNFVVNISCTKQPGNWLAMEAEENHQLIVRQTYLDRQNEVPAELSIERIGENTQPAPLSAEIMRDNLQRAATYVSGSISVFIDWTENFKKEPNSLNALSDTVKASAHGDPNLYYFMGYWTLAEDEALIISVMPPECEYWNFQLNNYWMESLDYRFHCVDLNAHKVQYNEDGSFQLIVAHKDPGHVNWIETAGHGHGTMGLRWVNAREYPRPNCKVLKLSELADY